jgi:uncharacterized repeat protein (TIGR02543 family)
MTTAPSETVWTFVDSDVTSGGDYIRYYDGIYTYTRPESINYYNMSTLITSQIFYVTYEDLWYKTEYEATNSEVIIWSGITTSKNTTVTLRGALESRTGYTNAGWNTQSDGSGTTYTTEISLKYSRSLYVKWEINSYTVTYDTNGGSAITQGTATYGSSFTPPSASGKTGYTFDKWYTDSGFTTPTGGYAGGTGFTWNLTASQTFYAKWTATGYTLTWNPKSIGIGKSETLAYGASINAPTLKAVGYSFLGWNLFNTATTADSVSSTMPAMNLTYYAIWTNLNEVKFSHLQDTFDGSYPISISEYQSSISKSANSETKLSGDFKGKGPAP